MTDCLGKTAIYIFVAKIYGRMPFLSPNQTLLAVQDLHLYPTDLGCDNQKANRSPISYSGKQNNT